MDPEGAPTDVLWTAALTTVNLLVNRDFDLVERMTGGHRMNKAELAEALRSFGSPLIRTPPNQYEQIAISAGNPRPGAYEVAVPLWTEAGPTASSLTLHLLPTPYETFDVRIVSFGLE